MSLQKSPPPARRVRRLYVRAGDEDDAQHAATLLGDALRTASLRGADEGRLVVIRHLALGRIPARVSAASLALHIERVAEDVMSQAVTHDVPAADAANVVVFPDRSEAIVALAGLHARGAAADEWFWPDVVGGWRADASRSERWSLLLEAAHGLPEAAVVAAAVIDQAIGTGAEDAVLASVLAGQGARWLRLEGWSSLSPAAAPPPWRQPTGRRRETFRRWRRMWGPADDRLVWLTTLMAVLERPACVADPRLPGRIAFALQSFEGGSPLHHDDQFRTITRADRPTVEGHQPGDADDGAMPPPSDARPGIDSDRRLVSAEPSPRSASVGDSIERLSDTAPPAELRPERQRPAFEADTRSPLSQAFTSYAGLLLVVPILERLEFAAFLASHSGFLDAGFPARLLWFIGQRVGLPPRDPLAIACRAECGDSDGPASSVIEDIVFDLPGRAREILSSPKPRTRLDSPLTAWLTAVRRWCRRHARMGLTTLIRRPGHVHISRTHIDACFAVSQIDVRVRRLALDVDPGWVPWMGRVVQFSYGEYHDRG